ncbi:unnamed protein product [Ceutorhynchus assimilis]|uniref:Phosphatidylcholine transfer protein n=1 Tax=Ceutorhynchus assimilis TaxID=467358 RepID=A0A9N9MRV1_9CUCU|nr:unnamed protein product [Ceutorhynchus assimilis]
MYASRRISHNLAPNQHNLRNLISEGIHSENILSKYRLIMKRPFSEWEKVRNLKAIRGKLEQLFDKARMYRLLFSKSSPENTLKVWARQFEFVFAQRVRRGQQMICLYSKWWEERALKEFFRRLRIGLHRNGKEFIVGALGVSVYNWEEQRIADDEFLLHLEDLNYIETLKNETMCLSCDQGQSSQKNTRICKCGTGGITNKTLDSWVPFIEKDDLLVWRRPHGSEGLYEYKVYGSYHDVTAEDFLNVQVDTLYRKEWDTTAVQLEVGERDPMSDSNSDILYWEMQWPRLFVNRDYVFNRRYKVFEESKTIIMINKTTTYPKFPKYPDKYRVEEYWSCMVIKPYEDMKQLGIEFSLTYFDNPGVNIPSSVTSWVAKSAMPDYLSKLRKASKNYRDFCLRKGVSKACEVYKKEDKERREEEERNRLEYCSNEKLRFIIQDILDDFHKKANEKLFRKSEITDSGALEIISDRRPTSEDMSQSQQATNNNSKQTQRHNFWKYLHPMYYFT